MMQVVHLKWIAGVSRQKQRSTRIFLLSGNWT